MSLMRLLAAGSSIRGLKDRPCPYKMTQQHLLPKFGPGKPAEAKSVVPVSSAKEPGSAGARSENEGTQMTLVEAEDKQQPTGGVRPSPGAANCEGSSMSDLSQAVQVSHVAAPGDGRTPPVGSYGFFRRWARVKNPFRSKLAVKRSVTPVQGELSLESIKVVRNDLNEADLEVVAAAPKSAGIDSEPKSDCSIPHLTQREPGVGGRSAESARLAWHRITARLFGSRRT